MMRRLMARLPIRQKLALISVATVVVALAVACTGFVLLQQLQARGEFVERVGTVARIAGDNAASAILFRDPDSAGTTLDSLKALEDVAIAVVYDRDGAVFATYIGVAHGNRPFTAPPRPAPGDSLGTDTLEVVRPITVAGEPVGTIYVRATLGELRETLWRNGLLAGVVMLVASLAALLLAWRWTRVISEPIAHLSGVVAVVGRIKDYSVRAVRDSDDELGALMDGFNGMLGQIQARDVALRDARDGLEARVSERTRELRQQIAERERAERELEATHRRLLEASRLGGMAEVATNVLHNVGNVLNSVNVSAHLIAERCRNGTAARVERLIALLHEHRGDLGAFLTADPRGRQVPDYLARLAERMNADELTIAGELHELRKNIDHIIEIVSMQQDYAKVSGVRETVDLRELVKDSVRLNADALTRHGVTVEEHCDAVPAVTVEKHKALQILVNLVRNAKLACVESGRPDKRVALRLQRHGGGVHVSVSDNGVGIAPENLTQIFSHGFTTRRDGHGFGLHSGALAAREMGGTLRVHSDGPGRGATFTLELPLAQQEA